MQQKRENTELLVENIVKGIQEKKGKKIATIDLNGIPGVICNYFIVCEGNSPNQVSAISESIREYVKKTAYVKPMFIDGEKNAQWIAMDYGDIIVHVFLPEIRSYYQLENLWHDAKLTYIPDLD